MNKETGKYPKKDQKGMVLILTFIIIAALAAIVAVFLYLTSTQLKSSGHDAVSHKVFWLAEAGIQKAIWYLQRGGLTGGVGTITENLGDGSYTTVVTDAGSGTRTITSTGTVGVISRTIQQTVTVKNPYQTGYGVTEYQIGYGKDWNEQ